MDTTEQQPEPALHVARPKRTAGGSSRRLVSADGWGTVGSIERCGGGWLVYGAAITRAGQVGQAPTQAAAANLALQHYLTWREARKVAR